MKNYLIMGAMLVILIGVFYTYYRVTQNQMTVMRAEISAQSTALEIQERTIDSLQRDITSQSQVIVELDESFRASRARVEELQRRFNQTTAGAPRDFGNLAAERPGLIQGIVNNASRDAMRCIELDSGRNISDYGLSSNEEQRLLETCGIR